MELANPPLPVTVLVLLVVGYVCTLLLKQRMRKRRSDVEPSSETL